MNADAKVAIVPGAASGVGRASAIALLEDGYRVVLAGRRAERLRQSVAESGFPESRALAVPTDVPQFTNGELNHAPCSVPWPRGTAPTAAATGGNAGRRKSLYPPGARIREPSSPEPQKDAESRQACHRL
jgi:NAD(P)-dependent dehydrogenase (short-subunit alcohol dehydrogenase family)